MPTDTNDSRTVNIDLMVSTADDPDRMFHAVRCRFYSFDDTTMIAETAIMADMPKSVAAELADRAGEIVDVLRRYAEGETGISLCDKRAEHDEHGKGER